MVAIYKEKHKVEKMNEDGLDVVIYEEWVDSPSYKIKASPMINDKGELVNGFVLETGSGIGSEETALTVGRSIAGGMLGFVRILNAEKLVRPWYEFCGDCDAKMDYEGRVELKSLITGCVDCEYDDLILTKIIEHNDEDNYVAKRYTCPKCGFKTGIYINLSNYEERAVILFSNK